MLVLCHTSAPYFIKLGGEILALSPCGENLEEFTDAVGVF
jgi:hypothetical protein